MSQKYEMEGSSSGEDGSENVDQIISDGESDHDMPSCGNQEQTENSEYDFLPTLDRDIFPGSTRRLNEASEVPLLVQSIYRYYKRCALMATSQDNWLLILQFEVYYKDTSIDDVALVNKCKSTHQNSSPPSTLSPKTELVGQQRRNRSRSLGVSVPSGLILDTQIPAFSPSSPAPSARCEKMLRNLEKAQALKIADRITYETICSELISIASDPRHTAVDIQALRQSLNSIKYWEDLKLPANATKLQ
ncbi:hypothetical protein V8B55DRAFT_1443918 [Mucor lusitanicus]